MTKNQWPKSSENRFITAMARIQANYRIDNERLAGMVQDFRRLAEQSGIERFEIGVTEMIEHRESVYSPTLSELKAYVPTVSKPPLCGKCSSGWVDAGRDAMGNTQVQRCECRGGKAW